ncbi:GTP-binding protein Rheb homolog [Penaeus monodon]|uniref:GTP-binding protein Rheb homolog n=1 Tax=Penaeus monodon TaxID=6687 RepID=UPI0018A785CB|nr:GTP-binding protein Rheb homolog [Penaeus monodon]
MPPKNRKVAVMGYRSVGKSSLCIQFVDGQFVDSYAPTIENTFTKNLRVRGQEYGLELVDTAGAGYVPIVLVGNKTDLHMEMLYQIKDQKFRIGKAVFLETSAKQHEAVNDIFTRVILEIEKADGNISPEGKCRVS